MKCTRCGKELNNDWGFCPSCGEPTDIHSTIANVVREWATRTGRRKNAATREELIHELQQAVAARFEARLTTKAG